MAAKLQIAVFWTVLVGCMVPAAAGAPLGRSVTITVPERGAAARRGEYVNFGAPIPRAWKITDLSALRLTSAAGKAIPAQFEALARWAGGPDSKTAAVKWVLVGYLETLAAKGSRTVVLDTLGPGPAPPVKIRIDAAKSGKLLVDTAAARFELNTDDRFNLFEQVEVSGKKLLAPLAPREAIRYAPAGKLSIVVGGKPNLKPRATKATIERAGPLGAVVRVVGNILDAASRPVLNFSARMHFTAGRSDVRVDFTVENNHPIIPTDTGAVHWAHGAYFGHSQHGEPGNTNPNRNSNSPSVDLSYGVPDLLLAYCLTGERRFRDVAVECLSAMKNMSKFSNFKDPVFQRERANLIFGYMEAYRHTADARWLKELRTIVGHTADLSNKQWVRDPAAYGKKHPAAYVRMFQFNQVVWTLGRYLDFCGEYGMKDDLGVAGAVAAYADFVIKFAMTEYKPGRAAVPYDYIFDRSKKSYLDQNNWALVTADLLAYAYKYTGKKTYLATAAKFYATGTIDPVWKDDPPVYLGTKDLVNACNWGLVYMNQSLRAAGK